MQDEMESCIRYFSTGMYCLLAQSC